MRKDQLPNCNDLNQPTEKMWRVKVKNVGTLKIQDHKWAKGEKKFLFMLISLFEMKDGSLQFD